MIKTFNTESIETWKGIVGVIADSKKEHGDIAELVVRHEVGGNELGSNKVDDEVGKNQKMSKSKKLSKSKKTIGSLDFLTLGAKLAFTKLRQAFLKALILYHFNLECYIWIETNILEYVIGEIFSQLTLDDLDWWRPLAFFSWKMIPAETRYETYKGELLAIIGAFKTWKHYLERSQNKVLILTNHNNLRWFMDTKSLNFKQVHWAQKLFYYHFRIDYCQGKANRTIDALSQHFQQSAEEKKIFQAKNVKCLYRL